MVGDTATHWGELALASLIKSPFFVSSLALHLLLFYVLGMMTLSVRTDESLVSIPINLLEFRDGSSPDKSIGPGQGPGGPRNPPKRGTPEVSRESSGKILEGSVEALVPGKASTPVPEPAAPALPRPKVLPDASRTASSAMKERSPDSLVQLPMKESATDLPLTSNAATIGVPGTKGTGDSEGIRALKEGAQIPGALKGTGSGSGPYGVPGGSRDGRGIAGTGTGAGTGGGSSTGLRGLNGDLSQYLKLIEKRVFSVWKYPDEITGIQKVSVRFILDRAGKLTQAEVLDSSDSRINASALEAMKRASPFPAIPENMRELAGEPLVIRFTVAMRVRG